MDINGQKNKKRYYIALFVGILAVLSLSYTVKGVKRVGDKLASINKAKNSLEQSTDTKISNEISSNYALNNKLDNKNSVKKDLNKIENKSERKDNINNTLGNTGGNETKGEKKNSNVSEKGNNNVENVETKETMAINNMNKSISKLVFNEEIGLLWPIQGDIVKNYSIEKLVYFPTLGVFKANPAVYISAKEGDKVKSAHKGIVTNVGQSKELGKYVEIAIGNDYTLLYGQLNDVQVAKGDKVEEGDIIAYIATPSPYYTKEGSHLYFKVSENGKTVDPMLLLR